jgi:hypothetical protein
VVLIECGPPWGISCPARLPDDIPWPRLYLVVNAGDVGANDPQADHEKAVDDQLEKNHRCEAR